MFYPFLNFNGAAIEVWEWDKYFHFTRYIKVDPC